MLLLAGYGQTIGQANPDPDELEVLARTADAPAIRLDEREAPHREIAGQKKETEDIGVSKKSTIRE